VHVTYRLRDDPERVEAIQQATLTTEQFGVEPTHGLVGSEESWSQIETGTLAVHTIRGIITRTFMGSHNDFPAFDFLSGDGELSAWGRDANSLEQEALYAPGRPVEIDYVIQRLRPKSVSGGAETKVVVEIRIGDADDSASRS
jgi:hypothetical protein